MPLDKKKIEKNLSPDITVRTYDSIDSTNNEAKRRAGIDRGVCLYASTHQTAGRGRRGHDFYSPRDTGLYMTLSLPLGGALASVQMVTCAAAVAVCEAAEQLSDHHPQIKWVNDIYVDGKKVAGILTELVSDSENRPAAVIIGVGLNLKTTDFPAEFADKAGSLGDIEPEALCAAVTKRLITLCRNLDDNSFLEKYKTLNLCIGSIVAYTANGIEHNARAVDIAPDGGLVVEENGALTTLRSGEVSVILR